jgi:hypothetical protein
VSRKIAAVKRPFKGGVMHKLILTITALSLLSSPLWADSYKGIIADVYDGGQSIKVTHVDNLTKDKETILVSIDPKTQISGTDSAATLKPGDSVSIIGVETGTNQLSAKQLSVMTPI